MFQSRRRESNPRPADYKSAALPTELLRLKIKNSPDKFIDTLLSTIIFGMAKVGIFD